MRGFGKKRTCPLPFSIQPVGSIAYHREPVFFPSGRLKVCLREPNSVLAEVIPKRGIRDPLQRLFESMSVRAIQQEPCFAIANEVFHPTAVGKPNAGHTIGKRLDHHVREPLVE